MYYIYVYKFKNLLSKIKKKKIWIESEYNLIGSKRVKW